MHFEDADIDLINEKFIEWLASDKHSSPCWVVITGHEPSRRGLFEDASEAFGCKPVRLRADMTKRQLLAAISDALEVPRGLSLADMWAQICSASLASGAGLTLIITAADHLLLDDDLFACLGLLSFRAQLPMLIEGGELWRQSLENGADELVFDWMSYREPKPDSARSRSGQG